MSAAVCYLSALAKPWDWVEDYPNGNLFSFSFSPTSDLGCSHLKPLPIALSNLYFWFSYFYTIFVCFFGLCFFFYFHFSFCNFLWYTTTKQSFGIAVFQTIASMIKSFIVAYLSVNCINDNRYFCVHLTVTALAAFDWNIKQKSVPIVIGSILLNCFFFRFCLFDHFWKGRTRLNLLTLTIAYKKW